jgi:hypothetical protein
VPSVLRNDKVRRFNSDISFHPENLAGGMPWHAVTNPLDAIYALFGLADHLMEMYNVKHINRKFQVDYKLPAWVVYQIAGRIRNAVFVFVVLLVRSHHPQRRKIILMGTRLLARF